MTNRRIEVLTGLAERLIVLFEADIAALEAGNPGAMPSLEENNQQLIATYHREAQKVSRDELDALPAPQKQTLTEVTRRFKDTLARHSSKVVLIKEASEGLIKAVATEVDKRRNRARPYGPSAINAAPPPKVARPATSAILVNAVV